MTFDVVLLSGAAGFSSFAGSLIPLFKRQWSRAVSFRLLALGAGILIATAFLTLLPEAFEHARAAAPTGAGPAGAGVPGGPSGSPGDDAYQIGLGAVIAFVVLYALENFTMIHSCAEYSEDCHVHAIGISALLALLAHGFADGLIVAVAFAASSQAGLSTALAIMVHEFPKGFFVAVLLLASGFAATRTLLLSFSVALALPLGAVFSSYVLGTVSTKILGMLLAGSAGAFLYVGAADLLPRLHKENSRTTLLFFVCGMVVVVLSRGLLGHGH